MANLVLLFHFVYVLGVVLPAVLIPFGWKRGWWWTRSKVVRGMHAGMMGIVVFEILFGIACPLTVLENLFLAGEGRAGYQDDFMSHWVSKIMYWQMPYWAFVVLYVLSFGLIIVLWRKYPPGRNSV